MGVGPPAASPLGVVKRGENSLHTRGRAVGYARMVWALMTKGERYREPVLQAA